MAKNYFILSLLFCLFSFAVHAQDGRQQGDLSFYPNPVSNGKIYIISKSSADKEVIIFDVLGKKVLQTTLSSRELNVSSIPPGVYMIKITEEENTVTRKLIIK